MTPASRWITCCLVSAFAITAATVHAADDLHIVVRPYLQYPTQTSIIVRWETNRPADSVVHYGRRQPLEQTTRVEGPGTYHEVKLEGLEPATPYFYQVRSTADGATVEDAVLTFRTGVKPDQPFSFVVFCDTQSSPDVVRRLSEHAYAQRPNFTLHGGDIVSSGRNKSHWTGHYFPNSEALNTRVPLIPAIGNHEENADFYYDYFSLPEPEYYYKFSFGNADFFMVDSNKPLLPGTPQMGWLARELGASTATWKIVCHHHPPYSSDENDYGDTYHGDSTQGDMRLRWVVPLYEKHGVDLVWNGHIHTYERTWPIRDNKVVGPGEGGIVYMITGGGGGGLENAAPSKTWFGAKVMRGHHYCYVTVHGKTLRIEAYDLDNRLFDFYELEK